MEAVTENNQPLKSRVIFVDPHNGSDNSGQADLVSAPFRTSKRAFEIAHDHDRISILPCQEPVPCGLCMSESIWAIDQAQDLEAAAIGNVSGSLTDALFGPRDLDYVCPRAGRTP